MSALVFAGYKIYVRDVFLFSECPLNIDTRP